MVSIMHKRLLQLADAAAGGTACTDHDGDAGKGTTVTEAKGGSSRSSHDHDATWKSSYYLDILRVIGDTVSLSI